MVVNNSANIPSVANTAVVGTGTGFSSLGYTPSSTASTLCQWDSNKNLSANSLISGYTTTATAASTTTLTVASTQQQYFTGSTTQTVVLPVTSTIVLGQSFQIFNASTDFVTVQSSGGNTIYPLSAGCWMTFTCILTSGTTAASWSSSGVSVSSSSVSGVAITSTVATNITSLSLSPGIYTLTGTYCFAATTSLTSIRIAINTTSGSVAGNLGLNVVVVSGLTVTGTYTLSLPDIIVNLPAATTYYLNAQVTYTGTMSSSDGTLVANRIS